MKKVVAYAIATAVVLLSLSAYAASLEISSYMLARAGIQSGPVEASRPNHTLLTRGLEKMMKISLATARKK